MHYSAMAHLPPVMMFFLLLLTFSTQAIATSAPDLDTCPSSISFQCGSFNSLVFPFTNTTLPGCGLCTLSCNKLNQTANISCTSVLPTTYQLLQIDTGNKTILANSPSSNKPDVCNSNTYISPDFSSPSISFSVLNNQTYVNCQNGSSPLNQQEVNRKNCPDGSVVYGPYTNKSGSPETASSGCRVVYISPTNLISVQYQLSESCQQCVDRGDRCYDVYSSGASRKISECTKTGKGGKKKNRSHIWVVVVSISVVAAVLLLVICIIISINRKKNALLLASNDVDMNEITSAESLQFDFNSIRAATHNFSSDNILGQGGFGVVYKGKLKNGQDVAVKRLSEKSRQGGSEFKTEVLLVAKLQHRNLVKLLGFCLSRKEKILVYEYLYNSSLDRFLSDPVKRASLDWPTRYKIICGIAKGLLYLHEDSRLKIIHRDLKSSNILLDEDMNPKISDFGLAKLFGIDQTQDDTNRIVGTYGYMAPEYMLTGHYSVKSDVYSFGIIVLEIVSGQKNRFYTRCEDEETLLFRAWKLWNEGATVDLADPSLGGYYSSEELIRCVQLGLMCIQEGTPRRPKMTIVVAALNGQSIALSNPTPPNFFSSSDPSSTTNTMTANLTSTTSTTGPDSSGQSVRVWSICRI